ncbi:hypothetical protein B0H13DRAFT_2448026 [Mycena leptocephala]|nr:hypothetical protein B0H13DRAFT_2448026 [Mycena leptocephala]
MGTPLVSPLTPLPAGILDRTRRGSFGPEDPHSREGTILGRVHTLADQLWVRHRQGNELTVRPGSVVSPQALYTGRERRANGQETYHAVLMNARLLIHNPVTGEPGSINGHASIQLHAAPDNKRDWNLEVPYVSDLQVQNTLTKYGAGVHREVSRQRRRGKYRLTVARRILQDESSDSESVVSEGWRSASPSSAPAPVSSTTNEDRRVISPTSGYITHPVGLPPPFDTSRMQEIGRTLDGDHVLHFPEAPVDGSPTETVAERPGTPRLPWRLLHERPALRLEETSALGAVSDDEEAPSSPTDDWLPANPADWTSPGSAFVPADTQLNDRVERVSYDALFSGFAGPTEGVPSPTNGLANEDDAASVMEEREEGEIQEAVSVDPRLRSRADHVAVPVIGTGRRGLVIDPLGPRGHLSPRIHSPSPLRSSLPRSSWTAADFVLEAERLIRGVVHHVGSGSRFASDPRTISPPLLPLSSSTPDALFDLELDNDSLPDLVDVESSDATSSSGETSADSGDFVTVRTTDCLEAMERIRRMAPTPDRDPVARAVVLEDLREWARQRIQGMDVVRLYLEPIVDHNAMNAEEGGGPLMPDIFVETAAERTLDLISTPISDGKRKFCDNLVVPVDREGKRFDVLEGTLLIMGENTKLALLYQIFAQNGQTAIAMEVGDLLRLRFRDSHLLARLLRSDVLAAEDYVPIEGLGLVEEDVRETERMIGNAPSRYWRARSWTFGSLPRYPGLSSRRGIWTYLANWMHLQAAGFGPTELEHRRRFVCTTAVDTRPQSGARFPGVFVRTSVIEKGETCSPAPEMKNDASFVGLLIRVRLPLMNFLPPDVFWTHSLRAMAKRSGTL